MQKIIVMCDSTSDLPSDYVLEKGIFVIPLYVHIGGNVYQDGVDLSPRDLYEKVEQNNSFPKTASPSPADFIQTFTPVIERGDNILFIGLSSHLSSTIHHAKLAANEFDSHRIEVVDSLNLSAGIGLLVMKAVEWNESGECDLQELANRVRRMVPNVKTYFAVDTLNYLHKGGRCSSMQHLVGSMLRIHPILTVEDGQINIREKIRGKRDKLIQQMVRYFKQDSQSIGTQPVLVNHSLCPESALYLVNEIKSLSPDSTPVVTEAGCVISSHCGPGTFSLVYTKNEPDANHI